MTKLVVFSIFLLPDATDPFKILLEWTLYDKRRRHGCLHKGNIKEMFLIHSLIASHFFSNGSVQSDGHQAERQGR